MDIIQKIQEKMSGKQLLFIFRGDITEKNSLSLLTLLENEMINGSYPLSSRKRLFMYVLEGLQNIVKHGEKEYEGMMPLVAYSKDNDKYRVVTANIISNSQVDYLTKRLVELNNLDNSGIKELYRSVMMNSEFSSKGGAGLGLIEMALKTGNRLDFDFKPTGKGNSYFILNKSVDISGMGINNGSPLTEFDGNPLVEVEELMAGDNIYMIWSGHVDSGIGEEVLAIAESRLTEEDVDSDLRRKVFNIMVEMLENVSKYNIGKEEEEKYGMPLVVLRIIRGMFVISSSNLVRNDRVNDLRLKIDAINDMDGKELKSYYYTSLSEQSIESDSTGNLGLVNIARKSANKLEYCFDRLSDTYSWFRLTIKAGKFSG